MTTVNEVREAALTTLKAALNQRDAPLIEAAVMAVKALESSPEKP